MIQEKGIKKYQNLLSVAVLWLYASDVEFFYDGTIVEASVLLQTCSMN
jgi:hypothetical protein